MQVSIEDVSSVKKVLRIEIPEDVVTREMDSAYRELKKTAKIKGFRPGKAPRQVLERHYGKDVNADVTSRLIQDSSICLELLWIIPDASDCLEEFKLAPTNS